jgi:response regulator of citrate/malate metabolism
MDEVKLLLVDDHEVVRTGLRMLLEHQPNITIVGEANTGLQALEMANTLSPDVVIMDITLPDISGIEGWLIPIFRWWLSRFTRMNNIFLRCYRQALPPTFPSARRLKIY